MGSCQWSTADRQSMEVVRNVFFERADFTNLAEPDRELLAQALAPWEDIAHV